MSELKVSQISGLGGSLKINNPVGVGTVALDGYQLNSNGKVNVEGSVEVVTVPSTNFGVRIRAPLTPTTSPGFGDSTLQFTNNNGTQEWASLHAGSDRSLGIRASGATAMTISNTQVINHLGASLFNNTTTFNNTSQFNGQAIFANSVIPKCGGVPVLGDHLVNLAYLNNNASKIYVAASNESYSDIVTRTVAVAAGNYIMVTFVGFDMPTDAGGVWNAYQNISISGSGFSSQTIPHEVRWTKTGDAGHGRTFAGAQMGISNTIVINNPTTITITGTKSATAYNDLTKTSWVALLIKS